MHEHNEVKNVRERLNSVLNNTHFIKKYILVCSKYKFPYV